MPNTVETSEVKLTPGKRVLFLTKDLDLIKKQLYEGLNLQMEDLKPEDLLDDINTDAMTPAWVCFDHRPEDIAKNAYAGLLHHGEQVFKPNAFSPCRRKITKKPYAKKGHVLSRIGGERESQDPRASLSAWLQKAGDRVPEEAEVTSEGGTAEQPLLKEPEIIVESVAG